jgi:hypothetical protein
MKKLIDDNCPGEKIYLDIPEDPHTSPSAAMLDMQFETAFKGFELIREFDSGQESFCIDPAATFALYLALKSHFEE